MQQPEISIHPLIGRLRLNEYGAPYPQLAKELRGTAAELAALKYEVLQKVGGVVGDTQTFQL